MFIFFGLHTIAQAEKVNDSKNSMTRYKGKAPEGVCFETSPDKYLIKKKHTVSDLMLYFKLRPLYCENCSVETAQEINNIENIDYILPGQILIIPQKCANFSWKDDFDYENKLPKYSDQDIDDILKKREPPVSEAEIIQKIQIEPEITETKNPETTSTTADVSTKVILPGKIQKIAYNKLGAEPFAVFSEVNGKSSAINAKLVTNFGKGIAAYYQKNFDSRRELVSAFSVYQTQILNDKNQTNLINRDQTLGALQFGLKYHLNPDWNVSALLGLTENLYFEQSAASEISVKKFINTPINLTPEYTFYRTKTWTFLVNGGLSFLVPNSAAKTGTQLETEVKATHKLDFGRVYAGINYLNRLQNSDTFDFTEKSLIYKMGMYYLF